MQKVVSINLNGNVYQLDESGYEALQAYMASAERELAGNPDRQEIVADLEQAIADKFQRFLGPQKSVVTADDVRQVVAEMGPIETPAEGSDAAGQASPPGNTGNAGGAGSSSTKTAPKRLFRLPAGAVIAGVCNGIAAYFAFDVRLVRLAFVIAAVLSKGAAVFIYVGLMFLLPEPSTPEERASADGVALNAKEVIERAKQQYAAGRRQMRRQWRQQQRQWQRQGYAPPVYGPPPQTAAVQPLYGLLHLVLFITMAAMMISLVNTGSILQWALPPDVPLWAAVLVLFAAYQIVVSPVRAAHRWSVPSYADPGVATWVAFWNAVVWLVGIAAVIWIGSDHVPEIREFLQRLPGLFRDMIEAIRQYRAR